MSKRFLFVFLLIFSPALLQALCTLIPRILYANVFQMYIFFFIRIMSTYLNVTSRCCVCVFKMDFVCSSRRVATTRVGQIGCACDCATSGVCVSLFCMCVFYGGAITY